MFRRLTKNVQVWNNMREQVVKYTFKKRFQIGKIFFLLLNTKGDMLNVSAFVQTMSPKQHWTPLTYTVRTKNTDIFVFIQAWNDVGQ